MTARLVPPEPGVICPGDILPPPPQNLILITIDTTRADHLGCYGAKLASTPNLDAIARAGVLFEDALSPAPLTLPSHATIMTGLTPRRHGVRDNAVFRLGSGHPTLASILSEQGYATAAIVGAAVLDRGTGIDRGFDSYDDKVRIGRRSEFNYEERSAAQVTDAALSRLASLKWPFFLWVHYYDPHFPYVPPAPFSDRYRAGPYDGEIAYVDAQIGRLLKAPKISAMKNSTLLVVAGDHGESLGEHGEDRHDLFVYQATQRVPLILRGPAIPRGRTISRRVGLVDLLPTVLDLLGLSLPSNVDGRSLTPLLAQGSSPGSGGIRNSAPGPRGSSDIRVVRETQGSRDEIGATSGTRPTRTAAGGGSTNVGSHQDDPSSTATYELESFFPAYSYNWAPSMALVSGRWKYVATPRPELYDLAADPQETRDLLRGLEPSIQGKPGSETSVSRNDSRARRPGQTATSADAPSRRAGSNAREVISQTAANVIATAGRLAADLRSRYKDDAAARAFEAPSCTPGIERACGLPEGAPSSPASSSPSSSPPSDAPGASPREHSSRPETPGNTPSASSASASSGPPAAGEPRPSSSPPASAPGEDEQRERLAALGYLGGSVRPGEHPAPGPHRDPKDGVGIVRELDRARALLQGGRPAEAARALETVASKDERNFPVLATLGSACLAAGLYDRSIEIHRRTLALRPNDALPHANVAGALRAKAASLDGASPGEPGREPSDSRAAALREDAAKEYEQALRLAPRDSESYLGYAQLELERSRSQAARAILDRSHQAGAADPEIYVLQGRVEASLGGTRAARAAFERALTMDPRAHDAHEGLGHLDYEAGDARAAEAHYARALELAPSASRAKTLGAIRLYALSDREGARAAFRRALELSPGGADAREIAAILRDLDDDR